MKKSKRPPIAVLDALRRGRSFVLPLHIDPDGDSVGSTIALTMALRTLGKKVVTVSHDPVPGLLNFLPGVPSVSPLSDAGDDFDTLVIVDQSDPGRCGIAVDAMRGKFVINIDHHRSNVGFGDYRYVDATASSCSELVYYVIQKLGVPLTQEMADLLYAGIMTDTGSFRYNSTTAHSLWMAARMIEAGARPAELARRIYEVRPLSTLHLMGHSLAGIRLNSDGNVAWTCVTQELLSLTGALDSESEGIINYTRMIPGVEVGLIFREMPDGTTKVGLRSRGSFDVSKLARTYGGGGHAAAAGFSHTGPMDAVVDRVVAQISAALKGVS